MGPHSALCASQCLNLQVFSKGERLPHRAQAGAWEWELLFSSWPLPQEMRRPGEHGRGVSLAGQQLLTSAPGTWGLWNTLLGTRHRPNPRTFWKSS